MKDRQYFTDINGDGTLEVAIMLFDKGNPMTRRALVVTVKADRLECLRAKADYHLEPDCNVFP